MGCGGVFDGRGKAGACSGARAEGVFEITEPTAFGRGKAGCGFGARAEGASMARAEGGFGVGFVPCFSTSARGRACADVINPNDTLVYNGDLSFSKKRSSGFSVFENPAVLCGSELWGVEKEKGNNEGDGVRGGNAVGFTEAHGGSWRLMVLVCGRSLGRL